MDKAGVCDSCGQVACVFSDSILEDVLFESAGNLLGHISFIYS